MPISVMPTWTVERNRPGLARQRERGRGAGAALVRQLLQAHVAARDDGELGHRERAVREHKAEKDEELHGGTRGGKREAAKITGSNLERLELAMRGAERVLQRHRRVASCSRLMTIA